MPVRAVLLDATGTLIELAEPVGETYARVARRHAAPLSARRLGEAFGRAFAAAPPLVFPDTPAERVESLERDWWRALVRATFLGAGAAVRPRDFDPCFEALYAHFASAAAWRLREGGIEALTALRASSMRLAVVSNFDRRLRGLLEALALSPLLDAIVLPSDAGAAKPEPAIFLHALRALGVGPAEAAFVGDDAERDLAGAAAAGLRAIDVASLATLAALPARVSALA